MQLIKTCSAKVISLHTSVLFRKLQEKDFLFPVNFKNPLFAFADKNADCLKKHQRAYTYLFIIKKEKERGLTLWFLSEKSTAGFAPAYGF